MTDISGYEGLYAITEDGKVWSYERKGQGAHPAKFLTIRKNPQGYLWIILYKNWVGKGYRIHRLVAQAYIPNLENKPQVNHKNGIKSDNRIENLEWCTAEQNQKHANDMGLRSSRGINNSNARLNDTKVRVIRQLYAENVSLREIAAKFGIAGKTVREICARRRWAHIE